MIVLLGDDFVIHGVLGRAPRQYAYGWGNAGPVPGFVSASVGTSILPVRVNCRPEYLILRLRPAGAAPTPVATFSVPSV